MTFDCSRREVIAACLELAGKGYLPGTGGNVALRIDHEHFAITPSAMDYYAMTSDDVCVLRLKDLVQTAGDRRPSIEHKLHARVFRFRHDCRASIHTHQPIASAYTLLGRDLRVTLPAHQVLLGTKAVSVGYAPSGTGWLASKLARSLRPEVNAYLLRNHGVVCCGSTLTETLTRLETLESACSSFFRAAITGRPGSGWNLYMAEVLTLLMKREERESPR